MSVTILDIMPHSISEKHDIRPLDELISINGNTVDDVLDYQFYIAETTLRIVVSRGEHRFYAKKIHKNQYEDIGLLFKTYLMDKQRSCTNNCIFCFVDQMPPNMRESLYFKDDDARLSFLLGNYITLTNLKQSEIDRIIKMKISPINISVHTTNPDLRCEMMHNRFAGERLDYLRQLCDSGINVNCQLVLCPNINDGKELASTLETLGKFYPNVLSVACVPVGLTKFRDGLFELKQYDEQTACNAIDIIENFSKKFFVEHGAHLAYASDEFYLRAKKPLPTADYYEDFAQLENGVGVIATLYSDFHTTYGSLEGSELVRNISIATGTDAAPFISDLVKMTSEKWRNISCTVYPVVNNFFGDTITVAGLVTATDIMAQLKDKPLGELLILPNCMLRHDENVFLDDYTVADVERALNVKILTISPTGDALLDALISTTGKE